MKTVDYDALAASTPINEQAGRDMAAKGYEYIPNKKFGGDHWDVPPQTIRVPWKTENLIGAHIGRLHVIGLLDAHNHKGKGAKWLCRCVCGQYTSRRSKAIKNQANAGDRCDLCRHKVFLRRDTHFARTGKNRNINEFLKD